MRCCSTRGPLFYRIIGAAVEQSSPSSHSFSKGTRIRLFTLKLKIHTHSRRNLHRAEAGLSILANFNSSRHFLFEWMLKGNLWSDLRFEVQQISSAISLKWLLFTISSNEWRLDQIIWFKWVEIFSSWARVYMGCSLWETICSHRKKWSRSDFSRHHACCFIFTQSMHVNHHHGLT